MPIAAPAAGDRILNTDLGAFYNLLKGVAASGEAITLIYNAAGVIAFIPSSDPAASTQLFQIKNAASTVKSALTAGGGALFSSQVNFAKGSDIASAGTTDLSTITGNYAQVSGTTTITAFGTAQAGTIVVLEFQGALTLTHNASSLILRGAANATTAAGDIYIFVSEGSGNWREISHLTGGVAAANGTLVSRYINNATLNGTNSSSGTYVDFGGSFTTSPTTLAGDKVCIRLSGIHKKATAGNGAIVIDRGGTKLPSNAPTSSVWTDLIGSFTVFSLEYWDTPGAGTFTYKPQGYTSDANTYSFGGGVNTHFSVEIWR